MARSECRAAAVGRGWGSRHGSAPRATPSRSSADRRRPAGRGRAGCASSRSRAGRLRVAGCAPAGERRRGCRAASRGCGARPAASHISACRHPARRRCRRSLGESVSARSAAPLGASLGAPSALRRASRQPAHAQSAGTPSASPGRAMSEHEALEQRVRGEPVGPVHSGAGDLADGVEPGHRGAAPGVGRDAAHPVVRGGRHRDRLAGPVDARPRGRPRRWSGTAGRGTRRRGAVASRNTGAPPCAAISHGDPAGDDVARCELGVRMHVHHEPLAGGVAQHGSLAADGFGDQERCPGPRARSGGTGRTPGRRARRRRAGRGDPVAGRHRGVGRVRVELPGAAGGEDDRVGRQLGVPSAQQHARRRERRRRSTSDLRQERVLDDPGRRGPHRAHQGRARSPRRSRPRRRAAPARASARPPARGPGRRPSRSKATPNAMRSRMRSGPSAQSTLHRVALVAEPGAGAQGVGDVRLDGVVREQRCGDPALGVAGVALRERPPWSPR